MAVIYLSKNGLFYNFLVRIFKRKLRNLPVRRYLYRLPLVKSQNIKYRFENVKVLL